MACRLVWLNRESSSEPQNPREIPSVSRVRHKSLLTRAYREKFVLEGPPRTTPPHRDGQRQQAPDSDRTQRIRLPLTGVTVSPRAWEIKVSIYIVAKIRKDGREYLTPTM